MPERVWECPSDGEDPDRAAACGEKRGSSSNMRDADTFVSSIVLEDAVVPAAENLDAPLSSSAAPGKKKFVSIVGTVVLFLALTLRRWIHQHIAPCSKKDKVLLTKELHYASLIQQLPPLPFRWLRNAGTS